ncbi:MAG: transposase [Terriglobia bacterium]
MTPDKMEAYEKRPPQIAGCGRKLEEHLRKLESQGRPAQPGGEAGPREAREAAAASQPDPSRKRRKPTGNQPAFDMAGRIARIAGVDLTRIDGLQAMTAQTVIGEAGVDMTGWVTEAHFASWLGLCPNNQTSGGKVLNRKSRKVASRPAKAFRMAANSLPRSQSYLGSQCRRLRARLGAPKAITAMAHKLARLTCRLLKYGSEYVDKGMKYYQEKYRRQELSRLQKKATELGMQLVETTAMS